MKILLIRTLKLVVIAYIVICVLLYFFQERLIFFPEKLDKSFQFTFGGDFEELNFTTKDKLLLNGVLFKATHSKGLIFYLHGNAGSINSWEDVAKTYTNLRYDVLIIDYRGYGKSEGKISSEKQLFDDLQIVYDAMKTRYAESNIVVLGYSIGSGLAAKVASVNHPKLLILQTPYYSLTDMMQHRYPLIPTFILKYKFATNRYIADCKMPVVIFHGDRDEVIYYNSSVKLKALLKPGDSLITLKGQAHNGVTDNQDYQVAIRKILSE